jgi:hypothetical protein
MEAFSEVSSIQQCISNGEGADGVISETALIRKQLEVVIIGWIKLESRTNYITYYCS